MKINKTGNTVLKRLRRQNKPRLEKIDKDWNKGQGKIEKDCKRFEKIGKDCKRLEKTEKHFNRLQKIETD